jgi:hypothetical protein
MHPAVNQSPAGVLVRAVFLTLLTARSSGVPNIISLPESKKLLLLHPNTPATASGNAQINNSSCKGVWRRKRATTLEGACID